MTATEKLAQKKEQLAKIEARIMKDQAKAIKIKKEIKEIENFEVQAIIKDLNMPTPELKSLLLELKAKVATGDGNEN